MGNESTGGILPWGFSGTGEAYFVPLLEVEGNVSINGTSYNATGIDIMSMILCIVISKIR